MSTRELGTEEKRKLEGQVAKATGKKLRVRYSLDQKLMGGVIVKVGSTVYDGSVRGLTAALADLARADPSRLAAMSAAALRWSGQVSWTDIASATLAAMESVVDGKRFTDSRSQSPVSL